MVNYIFKFKYNNTNFDAYKDFIVKFQPSKFNIKIN